MNTTKKVRIEFTAAELETLYTALNRLAVHYSGKSESLAKICASVDNGNPCGYVEPDFYQERWHEVGSLQNRVYKAQKRIEK